AYASCNIRYGDVKKQLGDDMVAFIRPIREKVEAILDNPAYLKEVMEKGEEKAGKSSKETMDLVRQAMGLKYY
ncbi:MAG: tryptophan--tRNA ligase, partial [Chitinophagaceae bacterium]|nr:tryptophan--tRNA ligase [Chitinophagaceae bacterium]